MDRGAWWATVQGVTKISDTTERLTTYILRACVPVTVNNTPKVPPSHKAVSFKLLMSQLFSASFFFFFHLFLLVGG